MDMDSRNGYDDYLYYTKISYYDTMIYKYFDSSSLYFIRNIHNGGVDTIKNVIKNEMSSIKQQSESMYNYYMNKYFSSFSLPEQFFEYIDGIIPPETANEYYQNLYKNIQNEFNSLRDALDDIAKIKTDADKKDHYIKTFEKTHGVQLDSVAATFTRKVILAIMNVNDIQMRDNLTKMLLNGLNSDGSLKKDAKHKIIAYLSSKLFISEYDLSEADFEIALDIMSLNFKHSFNLRILADYMSIISNNGGSTIGAVDSAKYNFVLSMILKSKLLVSTENIVLYPEELNLLNNLSALKCYNLMNYILQLKFKDQYSKWNTVTDGLIPGLNNILNSREYKILNDIPVAAGDQHINRYYEIFNRGNAIPNNLNDLIKLMHSDMQALQQFEPIMHLFIIIDYFETSPTVEVMWQSIILHWKSYRKYMAI